jgi:hypothetical protein
VNDSELRRAIEAYEVGAWPAAEAACAEILHSTPEQADALQSATQVLPLLDP